jgi:hypothetical protein
VPLRRAYTCQRFSSRIFIFKVVRCGYEITNHIYKENVMHYFDTAPTQSYNIPVIDWEFDQFELSRDFADGLREADTANFYHDALNQEA